MDLILVGLNHRTTPIEIREKLAFSEEEIGAFLGDLSQNVCVPESCLLSTCNRTELYGRMASNGNRPEDPAAFLRDLLVRGRAAIDPSHFYYYSGIDAVRHLFRVSAGLDSMILGEAQIIGQVKDAYKLACSHATNGFMINRLMHTSFRVGGRTRSETEIGAGAVSVSMAAVELSQKIFRDLGKKKALVVGAGEMAVLTAEHFVSKRIGKLVFTNRTMEKAGGLAERFCGETAPWGDLAAAMAQSDIVITSTRSPEYLITSDMVRKAMHIRRNRPIFLIDIAVPRNIDPSVGKLYNVFSHNIDDLKQIIDRNLSKRRAEVPKVERIIEDEIKKFINWRRTLTVTPTIKTLLKRAEDIRREEIERSSGNFTPEQMKHLDAMTKSIVKKMFHTPITRLKEFGEDTETAMYRIDAVRDMFDLKDEPVEPIEEKPDEQGLSDE